MLHFLSWQADFARDMLSPDVGGVYIPTVATDRELSKIAFRRALTDPWHGGPESFEAAAIKMPPVCPEAGKDAWQNFGPFQWSRDFLYALHKTQPTQAPTIKVCMHPYVACN